MIRMVPFFFTHLLLMTLLFQHTEANKELRRQKPPTHDEAAHYQEFCLSIPEAPRSTRLDFETPQPTKSASKPKPPREKPNTPKLRGQQPRPKQPAVPGAPLPEEKTYPPAGVPEIVPIIAPFGLYSSDRDIEVSDGCYCKEQNKKSSTETYQVSSLTIHYPSETCRSTEYIEILKDGRKVCVTSFSLLGHFLRTLSQPVPEQRSTESPEITSTTHQSTTAETSTPTQPQIRIDGSFMHYGPAGNLQDTRHDVKGSDFLGPVKTMTAIHPSGLLVTHLSVSAIEEPCIFCMDLVTWNNFDPKDVQLVELTMPSSKCPPFIIVILTDGRHICMNSSHPEFLQLLDKLENKEPYI
ncbi:uncharacterized protein LOC129378229 [Poeciliopsis prolifica]|uniref:uncharacterized protein LOC129378229 n=1 Tax=Poeciliopsis prolifica TaxID=188132 RepID=UPI002413F562|nr:uncharacterized protein LOC129378229 [Poeciliopsis prolifica]